MSGRAMSPRDATGGTSAYERVGILGAGAWGTALACAGAGAGRLVTLWAYEKALVSRISEERENPLYLPDIRLPEGIRATNALADIAREPLILLVCPAQNLREILLKLKSLYEGQPLIICSKGLETESGLFLSDVAREALGDAAPIGVLSGPSFAHEVARGKPVALDIAGDATLIQRFQETFQRPHFRLYPSSDVRGAQLGGAIKNVVAIACGVVDGLALGENARAAVITRGFAEMLRLADALAIERETLCGLSGLGDLLLTCGSRSSRNMSLGHALGRGERLEAIMARGRVAREGVKSAPAVLALAERLGVEMPLCAAVDSVLSGGRTVSEAVGDLLARPPPAIERRHE